MIEWVWITFALGCLCAYGAVYFFSKRKCDCGHLEKEHLDEIQRGGDEIHPGVCLGNDFRCHCMKYSEYT
jgi:hypothetical protein